MKQLAREFKCYFHCLGENTEKYITFSVPIKNVLDNDKDKDKDKDKDSDSDSDSDNDNNSDNDKNKPKNKVKKSHTG